MKKHRLVVVFLGLIVLVAAGTLGYLFLEKYPASPLPESVVAQADFPVFFPSPMPEGYSLKDSGVDGSSNAVFFTLRDTQNNSDVVITMQPIPAGFDAAKIIGNSPIPTTLLENGSLYNLSVGGSTKYMLVGDKTLFFITSVTTVSTKDITTIINSLKEVTR